MTKRKHSEELTPQGKRVLGTFVGLALAMVAACIVGLLVVQVAETRQKIQLSHHGVHATGTVTSHTQEFITVGRSSSQEEYFVSYSFRPTDGLPQTHQRLQLQPDTWKQLAVGKHIDITYQRDHPANNLPTASLKELSPDITLEIGFMASVAVLLLIIFVDRHTFTFSKRKGVTSIIALFAVVVLSSFIGFRIITPAVTHSLQRLLF